MTTHNCGQCGKELDNLNEARFYFEDDSWLCDECFSYEDSDESEFRANSAEGSGAPARLTLAANE